MTAEERADEQLEHIRVGKLLNAAREETMLANSLRSMEVEIHDMQMAAISVGAGANTRASLETRISRDNTYWTPALGDVYTAIDREIALREALQELYDWQNGPPLSSRRWLYGWGSAMKKAQVALGMDIPP